MAKGILAIHSHWADDRIDQPHGFIRVSSIDEARDLFIQAMFTMEIDSLKEQLKEAKEEKEQYPLDPDMPKTIKRCQQLLRSLTPEHIEKKLMEHKDCAVHQFDFSYAEGSYGRGAYCSIYYQGKFYPKPIKVKVD